MSDAALGVGSRFGPYQLLQLLGRGGMGEVYQAEDTRKHRVVALKLISAQYSHDAVFRARMQREADTAGRLTEPHIVPIHDYGEIDGQFFVEMRLIDGVSLHALLKQHGPLNPARAVAIVQQIAAALDAAHANEVIHRDIKPENILVTANDFAYLVDFGIAHAAAAPGLTQTGTAVGTYNYMAPERFAGTEVTYRADIYSLAGVLAECLTGAPPYQADNVERLITAHLMKPAPQPSQLRPGQVPAALDTVIAKGMAKIPEDRYASAGELANAAHDALTVSEQHQATTILRQGDNATLLAALSDSGLIRSATEGSAIGAGLAPWNSGGAETMAAPMSMGSGSWPHLGQPPSGSHPDPNTTEPNVSHAVPSPRDKRKMRAIVGAVAVLLVAGLATAGYLVLQPSSSSKQPPGQTVLPFTGIDFRLSPSGVAVDSEGNKYVTSESMYGRVVKLAAGSNTSTILPFDGLYQPQVLAVDGADTIYVTDFNNRVVALQSGSNSQIVLPFDGLNYPEGLGRVAKPILVAHG